MNVASIWEGEAYSKEHGLVRWGIVRVKKEERVSQAAAKCKTEKKEMNT